MLPLRNLIFCLSLSHTHTPLTMAEDSQKYIAMSLSKITAVSIIADTQCAILQVIAFTDTDRADPKIPVRQEEEITLI